MRDAQVMLRGLRGLQLIGGDVCEVSPPLDPTGHTRPQWGQSDVRDPVRGGRRRGAAPNVSGLDRQRSGATNAAKGLGGGPCPWGTVLLVVRRTKGMRHTSFAQENQGMYGNPCLSPHADLHERQTPHGLARWRRARVR